MAITASVLGKMALEAANLALEEKLVV